MGTGADVLVIGGGVIGLTTAYFLARDGVRVTLLDRSDFGQESSWAGAGIIPPPDPLGSHSAIDVLRSMSAEMFPTLSAELREQTGIDNGYLRCGGLEFVGHGGQPEEWHGTASLKPLTETELASLEPSLAPGLGSAFYLPDMAQVRNPWHLRALVAACTLHGVNLRPGCAVLSLVRRGNRIAEIETSEGKLQADRYLVASGAWSALLLDAMAVKVAIKPIRGQIALLALPSRVFQRILLWGSRYLVPRGDGKVLVGSTEEDVGFDKSTTESAINELVQLAHGLVPVLKTAKLERTWAGLRPGSADGLPFLGRVPGADNLYLAAGHYRAGIQLSPGTGLVMKDLLQGKRPSVDLAAFRLER